MSLLHTINFVFTAATDWNFLISIWISPSLFKVFQANKIYQLFVKSIALLLKNFLFYLTIYSIHTENMLRQNLRLSKKTSFVQWPNELKVKIDHVVSHVLELALEHKCQLLIWSVKGKAKMCGMQRHISMLWFSMGVLVF